MFDTGARTTILNSADAPMTYRVWAELAGMIGWDKAIIPRLGIGQYQLAGFEYKTRDMGGEGLKMILGNDLLKRFNLVFDNKNGYLYMQPNTLADAAYGKPDEYYVVRAVVFAFILVVLVVAYKKVGKKSAHTRKIA
jgi:hypothetical protein